MLDSFHLNETGKILYIERDGDSKRPGSPQGQSQNGTKLSETTFRLENKGGF